VISFDVTISNQILEELNPILLYYLVALKEKVGEIKEKYMGPIFMMQHFQING